MLKDLSELKEEVEALVNNYLGNEFVLPREFKELFLSQINENEQIEFLEYSAIHQNARGKVYIPNQWFYLAALVAPYTNEIIKYKNRLLSFIPNEQFEHVISESKRGNIHLLITLMDQNNIAEEEKNKLKTFTSNYDSWNGAKLIYRSDFFVSPTLSLLNVLAASSEFIASGIVKKYVASDQLLQQASELLNITLEEKKDSLPNVDTSEFSTGGVNKIYYGAPGTGKSWKVNEEFSEYNRITFHPEYSYFDFVGGIKPQKKADTISYEFIPGPFTKALKEAFNNPEKNIGLIIEEINRANTAAVFGDIFQLLDRNDNGESEYKIKNSDLTDYLQDTIKKKIPNIYLPSNFSLIATMNSSDQSVFVLDSAFKRRWEFEYMPINFDKCSYKDTLVAGFNISWKHFCNELNLFLVNNDIPEDKLIGPFFLKESDLINKNKVSSKLLSYLWDDVVRYNKDSLFIEKGQFSNVINDYLTDKNIFVSDLKDSLNKYKDNTMSTMDAATSLESEV